MAKEEVIASTVGSLGRAKRLTLAALGLTLLMGLTACSSSPTPEPTPTTAPDSTKAGAKYPGSQAVDQARDVANEVEQRAKELDDMAKDGK